MSDLTQSAEKARELLARLLQGDDERNIAALFAMAGLFAGNYSPFFEDVISKAYTAADMMLAKRVKANETIERVAALIEIGSACVDYAQDCGDCGMCGGLQRDGRHDDDCPVGMFLARFAPKKTDPAPPPEVQDGDNCGRIEKIESQHEGE